MTVNVGRVGVWSPAPLWTGPEAADLAAELDELGYGALWLGGSPSGDLEIPERMLAATPRMAVATGIVNVWSEPAEAVAASYHRIADRYTDRFLLGLGPSHHVLVENYQRPFTKLVSYLDELDAAERPVPLDGRALAALGPKALRLSAERSAGAHPYLVTPEHTRQAREILGAGPLLAPNQMVLLETDAGKAREIARERLRMYLALPNYTNNFRRLGFTEDDIAAGGSDRLVDAMVAWGDVATVRKRVEEHHAAGADHVNVQVLADDQSLAPQPFRILAEALLR